MSWPAVTPAGPPSFRRYRSGAWYGTGRPQTAAGTTAVVADTIYAFPLLIPEPARMESIGLLVGTPVVGALGRVALYTCSPTEPAPQSLIVGSLTDLDFNAAANTTYTVLIQRQIPAGCVMACAKFNAAAQPWTVAGAGTSLGALAELTQFLGASVAGAMVGLTSGVNGTRISAPGLFADPWPATFAPGTFSVGTGAPGSPSFAWSHS